ncbi:MAG: hypothetical protein AVDCRST_MAG85-2120 [uncultured Solirubrobacteraceae bacterium]|uniref:Uncharacterized protein n=1 Tax=uncultured Solirubrobacteraceae bacterium TaxID=1162706 RepID=A0A6J4SWI2_9ACTN|nr:MAG: hypothetical protein AVDCRST_MAG85-2120 [uncultured Solirubrobacteraceae bacterium]
MKSFSKMALLAAVGATVVAPTVGAETPRDSARGGGQVLLDPNEPPTTGALDTIAFTAQRERGATDNSGLADGQLQVNRRSGDAVKFHGVVECLIVVGDKAYISGTQSNQEGEGTPFELYIVDGSAEGEQGRGGDQAFVWYGAETETNEPDQKVPGQYTPPFEDSYCGIEEDPADGERQIPVVARGNYKVNDTNPSSPSSRKSRSTRSALSLR